MSSEINVTYRVSRALPAAQEAAWRALIAEMAAEVPEPEHVEVVITDEFDKIVAGYLATEVDLAFDPALATQYRADRSDGARAAARTSPQPGGKVVVAASTDLFVLGLQSARHCLLHESQHVRLHQHGDVAHAVHRRVPFTLPEGEFIWEFLWRAESAIDEFRCERTVHERGWTDPGNVNGPRDLNGVLDTFQEVRAGYRRTSDQIRAYEEAFASLDRLATVLGYGAAALVAGVTPPATWAQVPAMGRVLDVLEGLPGTHVVLPREDVLAVATEMAKRLRRIFQELGFDCYFIGENGDRWFAVN
ncbi:hypothetical protein [Micromonospora aurantiaca (nom. illeg.)]|uniref:hypothetical protein n=1 Tax=Micromonospora aurantiaca (nom. illeg.) TaxID=47850 RepID=UPI000827FACB|nr:hypothetical protein [Micromonospora aurantiaca]SCL43320.1 hypothetical protein GA0070615_6399 [Micromonospora aurantiaca]